MTCAVIAHFPVDPERLEEFLEALHAILPDTRAFDGCEVLETYVEPATPGLVVLWERWPSSDHHRRYVQWRTESKSAAALGPFLTGPITFRYLEARPGV